MMGCDEQKRGGTAMDSVRRTTFRVERSAFLKFFLPSLIGMFLFLYPVWVDGNMNIPLGIISNVIADFIRPFSNTLLMVCVSISAIFSIIYTVLKPAWTQRKGFWNELFVVSFPYLIIRIAGAVITILVATHSGPAWLLSEDTGGSIIKLMGTLIAWFLAASFLIPLLTEYGIMDFTGTLFRDILKPLFRLPGRAAIDLLASWVGNCNVGVVLTTKQYESGYYTDREAILIASCFSATSLPFCLVVAAIMGVDQYFIQMYLILSLVGALSAMIMSRIWPLHGKWKDEYYPPVGRQVHEAQPEGISRFQWALQQAIARAKTGPNVSQLFINGLEMFLSIALTLVPVTMCIGTLACCLSSYTPIFRWIALPFQWYFNLFGLEEAAAAAPGAVVGFVDMFIPALICAGITSVKTRFVVCILSLVQIIYMTEVGSIMLNSKLPVTITDLAIIFLEKTVIAIPLIILFTDLFVKF
jgi:nucleoside recognition membrane protein YjiH